MTGFAYPSGPPQPNCSYLKMREVDPGDLETADVLRRDLTREGGFAFEGEMLLRLRDFDSIL